MGFFVSWGAFCPFFFDSEEIEKHYGIVVFLTASVRHNILCSGRNSPIDF